LLLNRSCKPANSNTYPPSLAVCLPRPRYCHCDDDVSHTSCAEWMHTYAGSPNQEASSQQRHQHTLHTRAAPTVDRAALVCIAEPGYCNTALPSPNLQPIDPPPFQHMCSTCSRIKSDFGGVSDHSTRRLPVRATEAVECVTRLTNVKHLFYSPLPSPINP
jgi:hypothetical protein